MNISKENIDDLNAEITLKIEKADYEGNVNDRLAQMRKQAQMPGFRPGKVPTGLVKKMYGTNVLIEEINGLVSRELTGFITKEELKILGEPLPSEKQQQLDFDNSDEFEFIFDIALFPEVELKLSKRDKVVKYKIQASEELIEEQKVNMFRQFMTEQAADTVEGECTIVGEIVEDGNKDAKAYENATVRTVSLNDEKLFAGKKAGDSVVFNPKNDFKFDSAVQTLFDGDADAEADSDKNFKFTIKSINTFVLPEITQDIYDQVFGEDNVHNDEECKQKVKEDIEKSFDDQSEFKLGLDIRKKMIKKHDFALPEAFIKRWVIATQSKEQNFNEENIEPEMPKILDNIRWEIIESTRATEQDLQPTQEDILEISKNNIRQQLFSYGIREIPEDRLLEVATNELNDPEKQRQLFTQAASKLASDSIKEAIKVEEKEIDFDGFNELFQKENA